MKQKLTSRKFWMAILTNIISLTVIFKEVGGTIGTVVAIIGIIASSIFYMLAECKIDVARTKSAFEEISKLSQNSEKKEGE